MPVERPLRLEPLADEPEHRHLALGPVDAADALGGEAEVGHVVGGQRRGGAGAASGGVVVGVVIGGRSPCGRRGGAAAP